LKFTIRVKLFIIVSIMMCIGIYYVWLQRPSKQSIDSIISLSGKKLDSVEKKLAYEEVKQAYIFSPLVVEVSVIDINGTIADNSGQQWLVAKTKPSLLHKGHLVNQEIVFISNLGNQKPSMSDASIFSKNLKIEDGDKCVLFLNKNKFLSDASKKPVFKCNKSILIQKFTGQVSEP